MVERDKIIRGLRAFLFLSILTAVVIMAVTGKKETIEGLKKMHVFFVAIAFIFWILYVLFDSFKISVLGKGISGKSVPLKRSLEVILGGHFLAAVTPFQTGGFPLQIYLLTREGLSIGKGASIVLMRSFLFGVFLLIFFPFLLPLAGREIKEISIISSYAFFAYAFVLFFLFLLLFKPQAIKTIFLKIPFGKKLFKKLAEEVDELRRSLFFFITQSRKELGIAFIFNFLGYLFYFSIAPLILLGLGIKAPIFTVFLLQIFVVMVTFFFPTPGASGAAEGAFLALFSRFCPFHMLGVYTLLWRFFTFYTSTIAGGIVTLKLVGVNDAGYKRKD